LAVLYLAADPRGLARCIAKGRGVFPTLYVEIDATLHLHDMLKWGVRELKFLIIHVRTKRKKKEKLYDQAIKAPS
jgi:hypothetical protein